jgi:nicotinic acid mononucleotide adenylyltransferase
MARLAFGDLEGARVPVRVLETERELHQAAAQSGHRAEVARIGTYEVMRRLMHQSPGNRFILVLGADTYADLRAGKWAHSSELLELVEVVALPRVGVPFAGTVPTPPNLDPVSSSLARASTDLGYLRRALQPQVLDYILEHRLYTVGQRVAPARGEA